MRCYACHQLNSATARFCIECGAALAPAPPQPVAADQSYAPAPYAAMPRVPVTAEAPYAPAPYGVSPTGPDGLAVPYAAVPTPQGGPYAQLGYGVPQTAGAPPAMVNNVTVTHAQVAPPAPRPPAPAATTRHLSGLGVILRALFFLGSGAVAGALWASLRPYDSNYSVDLVLTILVTLIVLVVDIVILDRMGRG